MTPPHGTGPESGPRPRDSFAGPNRPCDNDAVSPLEVRGGIGIELLDSGQQWVGISVEADQDVGTLDRRQEALAFSAGATAAFTLPQRQRPAEGATQLLD